MTDDELAAQLVEWLPTRRWYQGKDRTIASVSVVDRSDLPGGLVLLVVGVGYEDGGADRYFLPVTAEEQGPLRFGGRRFMDALASPEAVRLIADLACSSTATPTRAGGRLEGRPVTGDRPRPALPVRSLGVEQSNSSAVLGDEWILKVLRRLEPGTHPDIELTAALTAEGFPNVPAQLGSLHVVEEDEPTALAVLSEFASGAREGWELATAETAEPTAAGPLLGALTALGTAVARMHLTLARVLGSRGAAAADTQGWAHAMWSQAERVLSAARARAPEATVALRDRADEIRERFEEVDDLSDAGMLVRVHGDLHLGQVMLDTDGRWLLLDFEGEPVRPLPERRAASSPLRDVAGMLRSFDYAAAEPHGEEIPHEAVTWRDAARERFLEGYAQTGNPLLPEPVSRALLLDAFELDKAVYELGYELSNRPRWVPIPVRGILRLLDSSTAGGST